MALLIIIYILSTIRMYIWTRNAYSKEGIYRYSELDFSNVFYTFVPFFNTSFSILVTFISLNGKKEFKNSNLLKTIFKIKNK